MFHSSEKQGKVGNNPHKTGNRNTSYKLPTNNTSPQTLGIPKDLRTFCGRGRRDRTLGLRFWRPPLYRLSYTPIKLVGLQGLEPRTDRL